MRRVRTYTYKQRSVMILVPLILLAISTWALREPIMPDLTDQWRDVLLMSARIFFPGLFIITVAFVLPTFDRCFQVAIVTVIYVVSLMLVPYYSSDLLLNPIICVLAALSSLLAMLPSPTLFEENFFYLSRRLFFVLCNVVILPTVTVLGIALILRQMNSYILFSFDETFGTNFLSVIYVPLYLILQTLGFQDLVGQLVALRYDDVMAKAFINAIMVSNMLSVPAILFTRSLFTKGHVRLFLTMLMAVALLTNSIGSCVSLILLWMLIFYPGSFAVLLFSSMICFAVSFWLQVPELTTVNNLYMPDVRLDKVHFFFNNSTLTVLEAFAVFLPVLLMLFFMWLSRERSIDRRYKWRSINIGYSVNVSSAPELKVLAFLRALGGISNIVDVAEDEDWLYIQVASHDDVSVSLLNIALPEHVLVDRINKLYLCHVGEQSHFLHKRLANLIANPFGESEMEVPLSTPFDIRAFDHRQQTNAIEGITDSVLIANTSDAIQNAAESVTPSAAIAATVASKLRSESSSLF